MAQLPPAALPTGTMTLLFTDIEGSTRLARALGPRYGATLETHRRLLREAFAGGIEIGTEGDSFFVAFGDAIEAVTAAVQGQRALAGHAWPDGATIRVRMGLHTGRPDIADGTYVGLEVHRAARIAAAGHGGQVLLSESIRVLVERHLPGDVRVRDLGRHRLRDLEEPEHLFQLDIVGLPGDFGPIRSLDARPNNLPAPATSFVGRVEQVAEIRRLLENERLVTLTGPGGTGKTRLALEVAAQELPDREGTWFVALAPITEPDLVPSAVAHALGVREEPGRDIGEAIVERIGGSSTLLVLDNLEQVLASAPFVRRLIDGAANLRALTTSRAPLRLTGEQEYPVPPLAVVGAAPLAKGEARLPEAVALFADRARAVDPSFSITTENAADIAAICARLDGLPLAIELAAARVRVLTPATILQRLDRRFDLLAGGARDLPERQRTLHAAIDWSYGLLDDAQRALFRVVSSFTGGWTLEALEELAGSVDDTSAVLDGLTALVEQSLVQRVPGPEPRFAMLETIREFGRDRAAEAGEEGRLADRHAAWFLALAERAAPEVDGPDQDLWLDRLAFDLDNLRAAIRWSLERRNADTAQRIATALGRFWVLRDRLTEGRQALASALALPDHGAPGARRARALTAAAKLATWQGDFAAARTLVENGLKIHRAVDDRPGTAEALNTLGWATAVSGPEIALDAFDRSAELFRTLGDERMAIECLNGSGRISVRLGDLEGARLRLDEAIRGYRRMGFAHGLPLTLADRARIEQLEGRPAAAAEAMIEAVEAARTSAGTLGLIWTLDLLADLLIAEGEPEAGLRIAGAVASRREQIGGGPAVAMVGVGDHRTNARRLLDEATIERSWADGRTIDVVVLVEEALAEARRMAVRGHPAAGSDA